MTTIQEINAKTSNYKSIKKKPKDNSKKVSKTTTTRQHRRNLTHHISFVSCVQFSIFISLFGASLVDKFGLVSGEISNGYEESFSTQKNAPKQARFVEQDSDPIQQVIAGRSVKLKCVVNDIGNHTVAWFHQDKRTLLAVNDKVFASRNRIQVSSHANSVFFLQINDVQLGDKGNYTCQLSTIPVKSQLYSIDVVKPPRIRENETTVKIQPVKEFSSLELRCVADGVPKPVIKWSRESQTHQLPRFEELDYSNGDGYDNTAGTQDVSSSKTSIHDSQMAGQSTAKSSELTDNPLKSSDSKLNAIHTSGTAKIDDMIKRFNGSQYTTSNGNHDINNQNNNNKSILPLTHQTNRFFIADGEILRFDRVSRYDMGFYQCIASNGIPPSVSQRIFLPVSFTRNDFESAKAIEFLGERPKLLLRDSIAAPNVSLASLRGGNFETGDSALGNGFQTTSKRKPMQKTAPQWTDMNLNSKATNHSDIGGPASNGLTNRSRRLHLKSAKLSPSSSSSAAVIAGNPYLTTTTPSFVFIISMAFAIIGYHNTHLRIPQHTMMIIHTM